VVTLVTKEIVVKVKALQQQQPTQRPWLLIIDHQQPAVHYIMHAPHAYTHTTQLALAQLAELLVLPHDQGLGHTKVCVSKDAGQDVRQHWQVSHRIGNMEFLLGTLL
jgi:hypothetical protein